MITTLAVGHKGEIRYRNVRGGFEGGRVVATVHIHHGTDEQKRFAKLFAAAPETAAQRDDLLAVCEANQRLGPGWKPPAVQRPDELDDAELPIFVHNYIASLEACIDGVETRARTAIDRH